MELSSNKPIKLLIFFQKKFSFYLKMELFSPEKQNKTIMKKFHIFLLKKIFLIFCDEL